MGGIVRLSMGNCEHGLQEAKALKADAMNRSSKYHVVHAMAEKGRMRTLRSPVGQYWSLFNEHVSIH